MSADLLKRAAVLMMERVDEMKAESGLSPTAPASDIPWFELTDEYADSGVLAWRPIVQIAVADLLNEYARLWESSGAPDPEMRTAPTGRYYLALATAYLADP